MSDLITQSPPKRVLVTGGAGFLGINLCRYLLAAGHAVRSLDIAPFAYPEKARVEAVNGDIRDPAAVERAMTDIDVVVHCAAALPLAPAKEIFSTATRGTRLLLESARARGVKRFVFTSSTAVYGIPDHHPIVETDRLKGVGPYGESKIRAEALCERARDAGLCVSVLRPKSFVGPERLGAFELLYDWAYCGRNFPVLGSGANPYQLLDVEDLCRAIELCVVRSPEDVNDVFNVGAKVFGTMREDFQAVLDRCGSKARNPLIARALFDFPVRRNIDAGESVRMMFAEMQRTGLYPPQYRESSGAAGDSVTVVLMSDSKHPLWDLVSDWIDSNGPIGNRVVCQLGKLDTVKASRTLRRWMDLGLLQVSDGRGRRHRMYAKPAAAGQGDRPFSATIENGGFAEE